MMNKKIIVAAILIILLSPIIIFLLMSNKTQTYKPSESEFLTFKSYVENIKLPNKQPIYNGSSKLGNCSGHIGDGESSFSDPGCTFGSEDIYVFQGSYRQNGTAMYEFLKSRGYAFKDSKSKSEFEAKLANKNLSDNLSNSEPIMKYLYNSKDNMRVLLSLGDRGRIRSLKVPESKERLALKDVASEQLIGIFQFYRDF